MGFILGFMWESKMCGYAVVALAGIWMIFGAIVRPYVSNVRPILNSFFVFAILGLYMYSNQNQNSSDVTVMTTYIPLAIIALLFIVILVNAAFIIVHLCQNREKAKADEVYLENENSSKAIDN